MKFYIAILFVLLSIFACTEPEAKETSLLSFIPNNPSAVIHTPNIQHIQDHLKENSFFNEFKNTSTYKSIQHDFMFCNNIKSDNPALISYAKVGKSLEFLLSINVKNTTNNIPLQQNKTTYNNTEYQKLENQNAYSILLDSTLVVTSSEILIENLIRNNNANIRYSNKSLSKLYKASDTDKVTAFINLDKTPSSLKHIFPTDFLSGTDWISAELNNDSGVSINGIATNLKTKHEFASKLLNSSTEKSNASTIIPSNFKEYTSYNFNELKLSSEFENFNELVDGSTEIISFKDDKHPLCAFKLLNTTISDNVTMHTTYRNHIIYKNSYFKIPATICSPQPEFACYIDDFIVFSSNLESLQNCISHFQNKTTLKYQNYYTESADALLSESHIIKSQKTSTIKNSIATVLNDESIREIKLTEFPLTMHQVTYEDNYIQFNSVLKKVTEQKNTTSVSQIASVTLDANVATDLQWVINHKTKQKEILVQDSNNQLYLISNTGTILWKKQLKSKIQGKVIQVDLYKNKKLQLAFTTENEFMVLDRNGKIVGQFYKKIPQGNLLPLAVFDYDNNRNYRFILTHGTKIQMYNNAFKPVKGFKFNNTKSNVLDVPKHFRIGTKDYIIVAENNGKLHILNRQGKNRTRVNTTFDFNAQVNIQRQDNSLIFKDTKQVLTLVNIATGKVEKSDILQGTVNHFSINDNIIVKLEDEKLTIKNKLIELDLGNYTIPTIFHLNNKYYISVTDIDTRKVSVFDSKATLLDKFPVYGQSKITATSMNSTKQINFVVQGEANSILIYKM